MNLHLLFKKDKLNKIITTIMLWFVIIVASAAAFNGFFSKWSFRDDGGKSFGIHAMIEGTAKRPFVYRRLLPETAKLIVENIPENLKTKLESRLEKRKSVESIYARSIPPKQYLIEYHLMIIFCYLSLVGCTWNLYRLLSDVLNNKVGGLLASLSFTMLLPFFEVVGGYYYDFPEILFMTISMRWAIKGNWLGILLLAPIATINKEAFFFFLPTLYPFLRKHHTFIKTCIINSTFILFSGLSYLWIRHIYALNDGGMVSIQIFNRLRELFWLKSYYITSTTYGLPLGSQFFFLHVIMVSWIIYYSWSKLSKEWKEHAKLALLINLPLYWFFCAPGELRNLSILYMTFCVILGNYILILIRKNINIHEENNIK